MSAKTILPTRRVLPLLLFLFPLISACLFFKLPGSGATPLPTVENQSTSATRPPTTPTTTTRPLPEPDWLYPVLGLSNAGRMSQVGQFGRGRLMDLGWTADNSHLIIGTYTGLDVYDSGLMSLVNHLPTPDHVEALAVSPVGNRTAAGLGDGRVLVWDITADGPPNLDQALAASAVEVVFSGDGKLLASGSTEDEVRIWDAASGGEIAAFAGDTGRVTSLAFSPDGSVLAVSSVAQQSGPIVATIYFRDAHTGALLGSIRNFGDTAFETTFSADGKNLFVIGAAGSVTRIDVAGRQRIPLFSIDAESVDGAAFSPDRSMFAVHEYQGEMTLWDLAAKKKIRTLGEADAFARRLSFSPDGTMLAAGFGDGETMVFDVETSERTGYLNAHHGSILSLALSPDGLRAATGFGYETALISVWDTVAGSELFILDGHTRNVESVAFSPDGAQLASASEDSLVILWDAATGAERRTLDEHTGVASGVAFTPDGAYLLSASWDKRVLLWNLADFSSRTLFTIPSSYIYSLAVSPDGKMVAAGGGYGGLVVRLAGLPGGDILRDFEGADANRLAFSPDSQSLSSGRVVWDTATGKERLVLDQKKQDVYAVAFSPDGSILAIGNGNNEVVLYDAGNGERLATLKGHTDRISDAAFTPDGRVLFTSSIDGTVRLWAVAP